MFFLLSLPFAKVTMFQFLTWPFKIITNTLKIYSCLHFYPWCSLAIKSYYQYQCFYSSAARDKVASCFRLVQNLWFFIHGVATHSQNKQVRNQWPFNDLIFTGPDLSMGFTFFESLNTWIKREIFLTLRFCRVWVDRLIYSMWNNCLLLNGVLVMKIEIWLKFLLFSYLGPFDLLLWN